MMETKMRIRLRFWWWLLDRSGRPFGSEIPLSLRVVRWILMPIESLRLHIYWESIPGARYDGRNDSVRFGDQAWSRQLLFNAIPPGKYLMDVPGGGEPPIITKMKEGE